MHPYVYILYVCIYRLFLMWRTSVSCHVYWGKDVKPFKIQNPGACVLLSPTQLFREQENYENTSSIADMTSHVFSPKLWFFSLSLNFIDLQYHRDPCLWVLRRKGRD